MKTHDIPHVVGLKDLQKLHPRAIAAPRHAHFVATGLSALLALAAIVGPASADAADAPVEVVNSGQEVIYAEERYLTIPPTGPGQTAKLYFDVPDGKRLIVEMINVHTGDVFPLGNDIRVSYYTERPNPGPGIEPRLLLGLLPMQRQDFGGATRFGANHLVKLRVDSRPGDDEEFVLYFERSGLTIRTSTTIYGLVHGYLVDLEPSGPR